MKAIRYSVHFSALIAAALVIWLTEKVDLPASIVNFRLVHFGIPGALHACAVVLSLRDRKAVRFLAAFSFVTLAAFWSAVTPIVGLWGSIVWSPVTNLLPPGPNNLVLVLVMGSAIGALGYWFLVRSFWMGSLRRADLLKTVMLCVSATFLIGVSGGTTPSSFSGTTPEFWEYFYDLLFTVAWWFAFSISLYWSESAVALRKRDVALGA